jgi:hypothetical protein
MRFFLKILGIPAALLVIAAGIAVWLFLSSDPVKLFHLLSREIHKSYGIELRADRVEWKLFEGLSVSNLAVSAAGGFSNGTALRARSASLVYNPATLPARKLSIMRLAVQGADFRMDSILGMVRHFQHLPAHPQTTNTKPLFSVSIDSIEVRESTFTMNGLSHSLRADIQPDNRALTNLFAWNWKIALESGDARFLWRGTLNRAETEITAADLGAFFPKTPAIRFERIAATAVRDKTAYRLDGKAFEMRWKNWNIHASPGFRAVFDMEGKRILASGADITVNSNTRARVDRFSLDLAAKKTELTLSGVILPVSDYVSGLNGEIRGDFHVEASPSLRIGGKGRLTGFSWRFVRGGSAEFSLDGNAVRAEGKASIPGGEASFSVTGGDIFSAPFDAEAHADKVDFAEILSNMHSEGSGNLSRPTSGYRLPPVRFRADAGTFLWKQIAVEHVRAEGEYRDGQWDIRRAEGSAWRASITASGNYSTPYLTGKAEIRDLRLKNISEQYLEKPRTLFGSVDATADFALCITNIYQSSVQVKAVARSGQLRDFVMQEKLGAFLFRMPFDRIDFDEIQLAGSYRDGRIKADSFRFDSADIRADIGASYTLSTGGIEGKLLFSFSREYAAGLPNFTQLLTASFERNNRIELSVDISGNWKKPEFRLLKP